MVTEFLLETEQLVQKLQGEEGDWLNKWWALKQLRQWMQSGECAQKFGSDMVWICMIIVFAFVKIKESGVKK